MKPRNKTERRVVELSATLPPLRPYDAQRIESDYKRVYKSGLAYYLILERCQEFQVIRYYYKTLRSQFEFMQVWLNHDSKIVLAKDRHMRVDAWKRDSAMTIKPWFNPQYNYSYLGGVDRIGWSGCFIRSVLPELRQRGLKTSCHGLNPLHLCVALLHNNRVETLFKVRQYRLANHFMQSYNRLDDVIWQAIRVALRHGYHWDSQQEINDWCDMIHDLHYLGLDTRNPHYICPARLSEAHQHYTEVRRRHDELDNLKRQAENIRKYEPTFHNNRLPFLDLDISDGEIDIMVIPTAMAIHEEGIAMHHCVGGYYNRPQSLILSAKVAGQRIETIEVNLSSYKLVQSSGLQNQSTKYHDRIVQLVNNHMNEIIKRNTKKLKKAV